MTRKRKINCPVCSRLWEAEVEDDVKTIECQDCGYQIPLPFELGDDADYWKDL